MILGSHDSITYDTPTCLLFQPFHYMAKCQNANYKEQYLLGVRCFDLRIRFDLFTQKPYICHGIMRYKTSFYEILHFLSYMAYYNNENIYIRLCYENIYPWRNDDAFLNFAHGIMRDFKNLQFMICKKKPTWTVIENHFDKEFVEMQKVPDIKTIWNGPHSLLHFQNIKIPMWENKDIIMSCDFVDEI